MVVSTLQIHVSFYLQVGPIAVTSANPTGEADTTHHNQVYAKLGDKVITLSIHSRIWWKHNAVNTKEHFIGLKW